jgi:hypothetical protein
MPSSMPTTCDLMPAGFRNAGEAALGLMASQIPSDRASVMLTDGRALEVVAATGHPQQLVGRRVPPGQGLAWSVVTSGASAQVRGIIEGTAGRYERGNCSVVVPIRTGAAVVGTFNLNRFAADFGKEELSFAQELAISFGRLVELRVYLRGALSLGTPADKALVGLIDLFAPEIARQGHDTGRACEPLAKACGLDDSAAVLHAAAVLCYLSATFLPKPQRERLLANRQTEAGVWLLSSEILFTLGVDPRISEIVRHASVAWACAESFEVSRPMSLGGCVLLMAARGRRGPAGPLAGTPAAC